MAISILDFGGSKGVQVVVGSAPRRTKYLSYKKYGGAKKTMELARALEALMKDIQESEAAISKIVKPRPVRSDLPLAIPAKTAPRVKAPKPKPVRRPPSPLCGIYLKWRERANDRVMDIHCKAPGETSRQIATSFSLSMDSLEVALNKALKWRRANGQKAPTLPVALRAMKPIYDEMMKEA